MLSKTAALRCFHKDQATRAMREFAPLRRLVRVALAVADHLAQKFVEAAGGEAGSLHQERISCQVILEKARWTRRWSMVSSSW